MITHKATYKHCTMKYSNYIKLIDYLSKMCNDKDYQKAMNKLDKFKIEQEEKHMTFQRKLESVVDYLLNCGWKHHNSSEDCSFTLTKPSTKSYAKDHVLYIQKDEVYSGHVKIFCYSVYHEGGRLATDPTLMWELTKQLTVKNDRVCALLIPVDSNLPEVN